MHVAAHSHLSPGDLETRLRSDTPYTEYDLNYAELRSPPKFFLRDAVPGPSPSAEVHFEEAIDGTNVVLRLMWGPLPAPFPRVLAIVCLLAAVSLPAVLGATSLILLGATALAILPLLALWRQHRGEKILTNRLSKAIQADVFVPVPH